MKTQSKNKTTSFAGYIRQHGLLYEAFTAYVISTEISCTGPLLMCSLSLKCIRGEVMCLVCLFVCLILYNISVLKGRISLG